MTYRVAVGEVTVTVDFVREGRLVVADGRDSVLAHVAWKFPGQTETVATEALGYIFSRSVSSRAALRPEFGGVFGVLPGQGAYAWRVFPLHSVFGAGGGVR